MILVQNRLRLLSGNKLLGVILIPLLLISCGAFRKTAKVEWPVDDVIVVNPDKGDDISDNVDTTDKKEDKDEEALVYYSVFFKGDKFQVLRHKQNFNIAILLPFHTDAVSQICEDLT